VRRSEQCVLLLAAAALVTSLAGCGEPRERTAAAPATTTFDAFGALDASLKPGAAAQQVALALAQPSATSVASVDTPAAARPSTPVAARKGASDSSVHDALSSFELVGTGIDGANAFAVVKTPDGTPVTVREGGAIGPYTVRSIRPDRIALEAHDRKEALLVIGVSGVRDPSSAPSADMAPSEANAVSAFLAGGVNTDQSIPKHVVYGPTAHWPEGEKHVH
jgi:hypothetical protein